jgi:type I restriction enzyme R subunit
LDPRSARPRARCRTTTPACGPNQIEANAAVEAALKERKCTARRDGHRTGKTFTIVNQIYRLMKAGLAGRVLLLVDRRELGSGDVFER